MVPSTIKEVIIMDDQWDSEDDDDVWEQKTEDSKEIQRNEQSNQAKMLRGQRTVDGGAV